MIKKLTLILILFFIINLDSSVECANISNLDSLLIKGVSYYKNGSYLKAYEAFKNPVFKNAGNLLKQYVLFMQGQLLYEMGEYKHSIIVLKEFMRGYPSDRLRAECQYLFANNYYKMNFFEQALWEYLNVFSYKEQSSLSAKAGKNALNLFSDEIEIKNLENIKREFDDTDIINIINLKIAYKYIKSGELKLAERLVSKILKNGEGKFYYRQALEINKYLNDVREQGIVIGLILPLDGAYADIGKGIYEGAELARMEFNEKNERKVNFLVEDSKNDPIEGLNALRRLTEDELVVGIMGPIDNNVCAVVSLETNYKKIPVIFPMTSNHRFSSLGEYVFQVNAEYFEHVKSIAEYALNELELKTFAILAPINQYGQKKDEYFKEIIDNNGGTIISDQGYFPGALDLVNQFQEIRDQGFKLMFFDSLKAMSDTLEVSILDNDKIKELMEDFFQNKQAELSEEIESNVQIDSLDISITSIDGLFLPIEKEDVNIFVSQFPFYNIETQVLGGKNWYNPAVSESDMNYINNMIFTSDYFVEETNANFLEFTNNFRLKIGKTPGMPEVYGYDCMNLFLRAIERGASTREDVKKELAQIENYQGIKGKISFDKDFRTNKSVKVLQYRRGRIIELK